MKAGETAAETTGDREVIPVLVEGRAEISAAGQEFGGMGERMPVFEKPRRTACMCRAHRIGARWRQPIACWPFAPPLPWATTLCKSLGLRGSSTPRSKSQDTRFINNIAVEGRNVADNLLVAEVFTPSGNWSSYPSHHHDEDDYPRMTDLEETYYHRPNPMPGFAVQRVHTEDGELDETMSVKDGEVVLLPNGHHPCAVLFGYDLYYFNIMAGLMWKWRFENDPDHDCIAKQDAD